MYLISQFVHFYRVACNLVNCYVCENSFTNLNFSPHFTKHKAYMHFS